ncbi:MAG: sigma-54-dependent Fis family transcriptional regulator [Myxococcales bacterium]|nr:MAG: sigma-54-dependent Fis family transcriptional regulator [Myxococcales bacterium]
MGNRAMSSTSAWEIKLGDSSPLYHQMRSPLRLHLLSTFAADPARAFDAAELSKKAGILVRDIMACLAPMVSEDIIEEVPIRSGRGYRLRNAGDGGLLPAVQRILKDNSQTVERYTIVREKYFAGMIGVDAKMKLVFEMIHTIARSDATVMIVGETGTGKELVASAIHELSPRATKAFFAVNCGTVPETLFESEMFGHEKGAFTGAVSRKLGRFELANEGTLFLDEVGELSLGNQVKLLRVLQEHNFERLGGAQSIKVDVRLIAATNRPLDEMIRTGQFREDLYYRINVFPIHLPSLRERKDDIPILATDFLQKHCHDNQGDPWAKTFTESALVRLQGHRWPGNVRELENAVTRLAFTVTGEKIGVADVERLLNANESEDAHADEKALKLEEVERQHIQAVLRHSRWNIKRAAELLGISRVTLYKKIRAYELQRPEDVATEEG